VDVLLCWMVVVTTVVEVPVPSVYVRTTEEAPASLPVGAGPLFPVVRDTSGVVVAPESVDVPFS